jgi:galactokinase
MMQLAENIRSAFIKRFNRNPLLVASPGRINLIGEHTDYNDGYVFPAAIDKYIIGAFSKSDDDYSHICAMDMNEETIVDMNNLKRQDSGSWENYVLGVIDELNKRGSKPGNFNMVFAGDIPLGAGLSSSAALENCVVFGLNKLFDLGLKKEEMIQISMQAEHNFAGVKCGIMDQFASMNGVEGHAIFLDCRNLSYSQIPIQADDYQLILINTNVKHKLADSAYNKRKEECNEGLAIIQNDFPEVNSLRDVDLQNLNRIKDKMPETVYKRCHYVIEENARVVESKSAIEEKDWKKFGELLFSSHDGLKNLYEVSCTELDFLVDKAKENPAVIGSRMMGGGFGGCTINIIYNSDAEALISNIKKDYFKQFGWELDVYPVSISDGVRVITS